MYSARKITACLVFAAACYASPAAAQATRTWVSGVGDDANPCSRTAPCKTFAGAISKTAAGGEINCLDPGGFGGVTITKAITINCAYTEGGVLVGSAGITINAGPSDVVYLRGLDIFGVNPGATNGVRFIAGAGLHIEDSVIRRFQGTNSVGVLFQPSGSAMLIIRNTTIAHNGSGGTGGGVNIAPTGSGAASALIIDSIINNNAGFGITGTGTVSARVGNTAIFGNQVGVQIGSLATIGSYGDNRLDGNASDGAFNASVPPR